MAALTRLPPSPTSGPPQIEFERQTGKATKTFDLAITLKNAPTTAAATLRFTNIAQQELQPLATFFAERQIQVVSLQQAERKSHLDLGSEDEEEDYVTKKMRAEGMEVGDSDDEDEDFKVRAAGRCLPCALRRAGEALWIQSEPVRCDTRVNRPRRRASAGRQRGRVVVRLVEQQRGRERRRGGGQEGEEEGEEGQGHPEEAEGGRGRRGGERPPPRREQTIPPGGLSQPTCGANTRRPAPTQVKKKRQKKDKNAPKRGLSAFMFFSQAERSKVLADNPGIAFKDIGKQLGERWKALSKEDKEPYEAQAKEDKERCAGGAGRPASRRGCGLAVGDTTLTTSVYGAAFAQQVPAGVEGVREEEARGGVWRGGLGRRQEERRGLRGGERRGRRQQRRLEEPRRLRLPPPPRQGSVLQQLQRRTAGKRADWCCAEKTREEGSASFLRAAHRARHTRGCSVASATTTTAEAGLIMNLLSRISAAAPLLLIIPPLLLSARQAARR